MTIDLINFNTLPTSQAARESRIFEDEDGVIFGRFDAGFASDPVQISLPLSNGLQVILPVAAPLFANANSTDSDQSAALTERKLSPLSSGLYDLIQISGDLATTDPGTARTNLLDFVQSTAQHATFIGESIVIDAIATNGNSHRLLEELLALGLTQGTAFGNVVSGLLPLTALPALDGVSSLLSASESFGFLNVGAVTTQADASIQADVARSQFGVDGSGLSIGVLSDSFNNLGGFATDIATGDLPANVVVLSELPLDPDDPGTDEGRAILQLIHDIAPGAGLLFHTAFIGIADFAQGIIDLANAGADIIIDDVAFFAEPFYQDGIIAQAVDQVTAQGVLFFSSAGNSGTDSYESFFRNSGITEPGTNALAHDFDPGVGVDTRQLLSLSDEGTLSLSFQYDESSASSSGVGPTSDYDIFLFEAGTNTIVASSTTNNAAEPVEIIVFTNETGSTQQYELVIARFSGNTNNLLKYIDFTGTADFLEFQTNSPTVVGHSNAAGAIAVGASAFFNNPEFGVNPPVLNGFSSLGGIQILFDTNGNRLLTPEDRGGPLFTAPDGGNTTFFGNDIGFDADSFPNFFGTSASAPAAAAAAALLLEAVPGATRDQIIQAFIDTAIDIGAPGFDLASGAGLIQVDTAITALMALAGLNTPTENDDILTGTTGADNIDGLAGNDNISGLAGNDTLFGNDGNDTLLGGRDEDVLFGGRGNDVLGGGDQDDSLTGNGGSDTLTGGAGNDSLFGDSGTDSLDGGEGDDFLDGGTNLDTIIGAGGNDTIFGRSGADLVFGGEGDDLINTAGGFDTIIGGPGNDTIDAVNGADSIEGGDGDDVIEGGTNLDTIFGGAGNDTLTAMSGADIIDGGIGDDFINSGSGFDTVIGGDGNDTVFGGIGNDIITGGNGNDSLSGEFNNDFIDGGAGDDILAGNQNDDTLLGGDGADTIFGDSGRDSIDGGAGDDLLQGGTNFDTITGGDGNDTIIGNSAADVISGGNDNDLIQGDSGFDTITGDAGNDTITGGIGNDIIAGNAGDDFINGNQQNDVITGGIGNDTLDGDSGRDNIAGGAGDDVLFGGTNLDTISGGSGDDTIDGGSAPDEISGGDGNDLIDAGSGFDTVTGGAGNDTIEGGIGNDNIDGGTGNDILTGDSASDVFVFTDGFGNDVITDFTIAQADERIDLSAVTEIMDFADLIANHLAADPVTGDAVITEGSNTITLTGVSVADLVEDDFIF